MPTVNPTLPSDGDDAVVEPYNSAIQDILAVLNGAIDEDNLAAGAVILSKLSTAVQRALVPAGTILAYGGTTAPSAGWLLCYGQAVSRSTYSDLFAVIGTAFGVGDGSTTFNLPDSRGRVFVGLDNIGGTAANRIQRSTTINTTNASPTATVASATGLSVGMYVESTNVTDGTTITAISGTTLTLSANATATASTVAARFSMYGDAQEMGDAGGTDVHLLVEAQMPSHTHTVATHFYGTGNGSSISSSQGGSPVTATASGVNATGGGQNHPNMQPGQLVNYIIKV